MFSLAEEADFTDGAVRRDEFDVVYSSLRDLGYEDRKELESEILKKIPVRHQFATAIGETGIVYFDKRGRACSSTMSDIDDDLLLWIAQSIDVRPGSAGASNRMGSEDPAEHGYITPVTEDLSDMGFDPADFIVEAREAMMRLDEARRPSIASIKRQAKRLLSRPEALKMAKDDIQYVMAGNKVPSITRSYPGWTKADYSMLLQALEGKPIKREADPMDPFDGPPPDMAKTRKFASMLHGAMDQDLKHMNKKIPGYSRSEHGGKVTVKKRRKFISVDIGSSGKFLIGPNNYVWGIKGYGKPHKGKLYGTLDEILRKGFSFMSAGNRVVHATPGMHESVEPYAIAEYDATPWDNDVLVEYKPKHHRANKFSPADRDRYQTALKRGYIDMGTYPKDRMSSAAIRSARARAIRDIGFRLLGQADGVTWVRDPDGFLDSSELAREIEGLVISELRQEYPDSDISSQDLSVAVRPVNGKTGKGYRVMMKPPVEKVRKLAIKRREERS
jgi:hypothetical protein